VAWIATGHTADDQAETVLFRILRGTGMHGLAGIPTTRPLAGNCLLVRPVLTCRRADVLHYLQDNRLSYCVDATNADTAFTRNRIRCHLLPQLMQDYNPRVVEVLTTLAEQAGEMATLLHVSAAKLLIQAELPRGGAWVVLQRAPLLAAPSLVVVECLRQIWLREGWPLGPFHRALWRQVEQVIAGSPPRLACPGGVIVERKENIVRVARNPHLQG
jgi:tRNA(Ile)-lysidine synthase